MAFSSILDLQSADCSKISLLLLFFLFSITPPPPSKIKMSTLLRVWKYFVLSQTSHSYYFFCILKWPVKFGNDWVCAAIWMTLVKMPIGAFGRMVKKCWKFPFSACRPPPLLYSINPNWRKMMKKQIWSILCLKAANTLNSRIMKSKMKQ